MKILMKILIKVLMKMLMKMILKILMTMIIKWLIETMKYDFKNEDYETEFEDIIKDMRVADQVYKVLMSMGRSQNRQFDANRWAETRVMEQNSKKNNKIAQKSKQ